MSATTLLLRLEGPMQSWGTRSRFTVRDTEQEPSKSGVIGLLCAALGRPRSAPLVDLASLRMGVRVDRPGTLCREYQTAGGSRSEDDPAAGIRLADGKRGKNAVESERYYLADASFLVGLEGPRPVLEALDVALRRPRWALSLGRKSYVPSVPVALPVAPPLGPGLREQPLLGALVSFPVPRNSDTSTEELLRFVLDADAEHGPNEGSESERPDVPVSFEARTFQVRRVRTLWIPAGREGTDAPVANPAQP